MAHYDCNNKTIANEKEKQQSVTSTDNTGTASLYISIYDTPPWHQCLLFALQDVIAALAGIVSVPFILLPAMCSNSSAVVAQVINTNFFVSGIVTILQNLVGVRLPVIQGAGFAFVIPALAILSLEKWQCAGTDMPPCSANSTDNCHFIMMNSSEGETYPEVEDINDDWKLRMREIQGCIIVASLFEVVIGVTGMVGMLLRYIGPLVVAPSVALIGISLFRASADLCATNWYIALMTMAFIFIFSQYLSAFDFPYWSYNKEKGCLRSGYPIFKLIPIVLAVCLSCMICALLTVSGAIPSDEAHWAYQGRSDTKSEVLQQASWFRVPYPGQWGVPTYSVNGVLGMLPAVISGTAQSIGAYYACAKLSGAPVPPAHAINRGILTQGVGCVLMGGFGAGTGSALYNQNVGAMAITKVGNRRVAMTAGAIMVMCGVLDKVGALLVSIPNPVIGGVLMVTFGMIVAAGVSNLQFVDMNCSRNLLIFGFSLFFGISLPFWINANQDSIGTGNETLDQILIVLLSTNPFVGGTLALILDNTIQGTDNERGLCVWNTSTPLQHVNQHEPIDCYNLPFGLNTINRMNLAKFFPLSPTFTGCVCSKTVTNDSLGIDNDSCNV